MIRLTQNIDKWIVPDWATYVECENCELESIVLHENVEFLFAQNNLIKELHVPSGIRCLDVKNNKITRITSNGPLVGLFSLDIRNNNISRLELDIADSVDNAYILGNPNIRIKNPLWLFSNDYALITTDLYKKLLDEHLRARLYHLCQIGVEYVDLDRLSEDQYCESLGLDVS